MDDRLSRSCMVPLSALGYSEAAAAIVISRLFVGVGVGGSPKNCKKKSGEIARSNYEAGEANFPPKRVYVGIPWRK